MQLMDLPEPFKNPQESNCISKATQPTAFKVIYKVKQNMKGQLCTKSGGVKASVMTMEDTIKMLKGDKLIPACGSQILTSR